MWEVSCSRKNGDRTGLAEAYLEYGIIARFGGADPNQVIIRDPNSIPNPTPPQLDASDAHYSRARELATAVQRYDLVSSAEMGLASNMVIRGEPAKSCPIYDQALQSAHEAKRQHPDAAISLPSGINSMDELVALAKKQAGCPAN